MMMASVQSHIRGSRLMGVRISCDFGVVTADDLERNLESGFSPDLSNSCLGRTPCGAPQRWRVLFYFRRLARCHS